MSLLLPALIIFGLRLIDVSLGTLRIQFVVQGRTRLAGITAFFESLVWTIAAVQVLTDLDEPLKIVGYAGGYAAGTMLGSKLENQIGLGSRLIRVVSPVDTPPVGPVLHDAGYAVTVVNGEGAYGEVRITFSVVPRRKVEPVMDLIRSHNPDAFVTVESATHANGTLPAAAVRK
jgi:uncharacterized protein YebE (UPF0316 family)